MLDTNTWRLSKFHRTSLGVGRSCLRIVGAAVAGLIASVMPVGVTTASDLDRAIAVVLDMNRAAAQSQKKVDKLDENTADLLSRYRSVEQQIDALAKYNEQTETLVVAQREQIAKLQGEIDGATMIGRRVTPLMLEMIDALDKFVELDVPFLLKERRDRVAQLTALMARPDVTEAEKYRRILEAYQIENEYGRTIEAYRGELEGEGAAEKRTVEFLRVGRVSLAYRTFDSQDIGYWDREQAKWLPLPGAYRAPLKEGFRIARKQAAPDLFRVPVPAAKDVSAPKSASAAKDVSP